MSILGAVASVPSHETCTGVPSSLLSSIFSVCGQSGWLYCPMGFDLVVLISILPVIRDTEHLFLMPFLHGFFSFS